MQFPFDSRQSFLSLIEPRADNSLLTEFKEWLSRLIYIQIDPKRMETLAEEEALFPTSDLGNFAAWYWRLRIAEEIGTENLRNTLREVIDGFDSFYLKDFGPKTKILSVRVRSPNGQAANVDSTEFDELSDGQRALVGLYTLLHCGLTHNATLCIDEPDNFVALSEIQPWIMALTDKIEQSDSAQVLIASHHPELMNQLASQHGIIIERPDGWATAPPRPYAPPDDTVLTPAEIIARGWET